MGIKSPRDDAAHIFLSPPPLWPGEAYHANQAEERAGRSVLHHRNWPDWRSLREIMRSDMSEPC